MSRLYTTFMRVVLNKGPWLSTFYLSVFKDLYIVSRGDSVTVGRGHGSPTRPVETKQTRMKGEVMTTVV